MPMVHDMTRYHEVDRDLRSLTQSQTRMASQPEGGMNIVDYYRSLVDNVKTAMDDMGKCNGAAEALAASHNHLLDYDIWKIAIADRPEVKMVESAVKEYQFSLFALASGQYRHAFGGLRLFFELMLAAAQFSAHEIDYRLWSRDSKDINWSALKDLQSGIFSVNFIRAFNPDFADHGKQYQAIAENVYRECSEFVHGNAGTHATLPSDIRFQEAAFSSWHEKAATMRLVIVFAFSARYLNYVNKDATDRLEALVLDVLGTLPVVQSIFSKPSGAE